MICLSKTGSDRRTFSGTQHAKRIIGTASQGHTNAIEILLTLCSETISVFFTLVTHREWHVKEDYLNKNIVNIRNFQPIHNKTQITDQILKIMIKQLLKPFKSFQFWRHVCHYSTSE
ncbi:Hypothetical_protein [Hexamita inflata]|uniref:Hypothetical_protein n=1 Tax=Hexamita inflata TaxID=28002 RepID=A0AA86V6A9_9EUKA|nr:Hypothetical protein HINF_LOCUS65612 [Hexamita inflata]